MNIDFMWSRETTDEQSAACARLLGATINQAIRDASLPLTPQERSSQVFIDRHARSALEFIFHPERMAFEAYALLVGIEPEAVRLALVTDTGQDDGLFDDASRARIRFRLKKMAAEDPRFQSCHPLDDPKNRHEGARK